jgi:hypothetical protein
MLILGTNKTDTILEHLPKSYLLIDDGPVIDALRLPKKRRYLSQLPKITRLDFSKHSFNPLKGMDYQKARQFITVLDAVFPEGANTLTKKNSNFVLLGALLAKPKTLDTLIPPSKDPAQMDAYQKIQTLLLSPLLNKVLSGRNNVTFKGILIAGLDRATLGDFDCFVLGNLLISNYPGHVVVPDFGFYASPNHIQLMRQKRLVAGLNTLDEVPRPIAQQLLLMRPLLGRRTTFDDAETLAAYAGIPKHINAYSDFIEDAMK